MTDIACLWLSIGIHSIPALWLSAAQLYGSWKVWFEQKDGRNFIYHVNGCFFFFRYLINISFYLFPQLQSNQLILYHLTLPWITVWIGLVFVSDQAILSTGEYRITIPFSCISLWHPQFACNIGHSCKKVKICIRIAFHWKLDEVVTFLKWLINCRNSQVLHCVWDA